MKEKYLADIKLLGVKTNNLKNIDISIPMKQITAIYGRSGAGKTSLAFSTLYKLCKDEFNALEEGFSEDNNYKVDTFTNIIPAVAINQRNSNNNPKSTLYSYLNFAYILSTLKNINDIPAYGDLKLNKASNECLNCGGMGYISEIKIDDLIDSSLPIERNPFYCWKSGYLGDFYHQLLLKFCELENIDINLSFSQLSYENQQLLLYAKSSQKILFKYRHNRKLKQRKAFFKGIYLYAEENKCLKSVSQSIYMVPCLKCNSSRVNSDKYNNITVLGVPFIDFLTMSIYEIYNYLDKNHTENRVIKVLKSICDVGLGYLCLSRSIPSLSGGELQKLKFSRLLHTNISGVLLIIDEISAQLNKLDYPIFLKKIKDISANNTIILVDHSKEFIDFADKKIHIGIGAGEEGGYICDDENIRPLIHNYKRNIIKNFLIFKNLSKFNIVNQDVTIPAKCVTIFTGVSGSGKSSLALAISEKYNGIYISQKLTNYTSRSIFAVSVGLSNKIADLFALKSNMHRDNFLASKDSGCSNCNGIGVVKYERGFDTDLYVQCPICSGGLFNEFHEAMNFQLNGYNIAELYNLDIKTLKTVVDDPRIVVILDSLIALGLSYLQLNRKTQTLSGGELRRIKLCEYLSKQKESKKILIIDEPIAGLDSETASNVLNYIYSKSNLFSAIILIEHREEAMLYSDYEVRVGPVPGSGGGKVLFQNVLYKDH